MAPRWPEVTRGPEHISEHATYLKEEYNKLQTVDRGRTNQVPWHVVQLFANSTLALISKVLKQPAIGEILQQVQEATKCTQIIQKDITAIKNSVGLGTTLGPANGTAGGHTISWAQVAARGTGSHPLPPPSPPPPSGRTQTMITSYKDRAVTIKLKDQSIIQQYRAQPTSRLRQDIETSIQGHRATNAVKIVAAHQLKSGDLQIFTSTTEEATLIKANTGWLRSMGEHAKLVVPTYGVIVHGIATHSINMKDQNTTIEQLLADNHTVIPNGKIAFVAWLTRDATSKRASSIVVEFEEPDTANAIIYAGMAWQGQIHQCQLYDRACRLKQCFRCFNYGHIGTQCQLAEVCGHCAEQHETRRCEKRQAEGFIPKCTVCKEEHTAWSSACSARKQERHRIEAVMKARNTYWHVPQKQRPAGEVRETRLGEGAGEGAQERTTAQPENEDSLSTRPQPYEIEATESRPAEQIEAVSRRQTQTNDILANWQQQASQALGTMDSTTDRDTTAQALEMMDPAANRNTTAQAPERMDPAANRDTTAQALEMTDPAANRDTAAHDAPRNNLEDVEMADTWLNDIPIHLGHGLEGDWPNTQSSPPTSMPPVHTGYEVDPTMTPGGIFKSCSCPEHQQLYDTWPLQNAELSIVACMKTCMYCGKDCNTAALLRQHLHKKEYTNKNITVRVERRSMRHMTLPPRTAGWTPRDPGQITTYGIQPILEHE
jgi:hypothetical protein